MGPDCNESTVAELSDGSLMLNMRSYAGKNLRAVSISRDGGLTWTEPVLDDELVEPVCQASLIAVRHRDQHLLFFSNPASTKRERMTVKVSMDDGKNWSKARLIYAGPSAYSNLVYLANGEIGLLFERGKDHPYERITFARLKLDWFLGNE